MIFFNLTIGVNIYSIIVNLVRGGPSFQPEVISLDPNSFAQSICYASKLHVNHNIDKYAIYILPKIIDKNNILTGPMGDPHILPLETTLSGATVDLTQLN